MARFGLTLYELELMDVVWDLGEATVQEVCDALERDLAYTTVMTTLSRLSLNKKVLTRSKRGHAYVYRPVVSREDVGRSMLEDLGQVLFRDRLPSLVLNMLSHTKVSKEDVMALRKALDEIESGK